MAAAMRRHSLIATHLASHSHTLVSSPRLTAPRTSSLTPTPPTSHLHGTFYLTSPHLPLPASMSYRLPRLPTPTSHLCIAPHLTHPTTRHNFAALPFHFTSPFPRHRSSFPFPVKPLSPLLTMTPLPLRSLRLHGGSSCVCRVRWWSSACGARG